MLNWLVIFILVFSLTDVHVHVHQSQFVMYETRQWSVGRPIAKQHNVFFWPKLKPFNARIAVATGGNSKFEKKKGFSVLKVSCNFYIFNPFLSPPPPPFVFVLFSYNTMLTNQIEKTQLSIIFWLIMLYRHVKFVFL